MILLFSAKLPKQKLTRWNKFWSFMERHWVWSELSKVINFFSAKPPSELVKTLQSALRIYYVGGMGKYWGFSFLTDKPKIHTINYIRDKVQSSVKGGRNSFYQLQKGRYFSNQFQLWFLTLQWHVSFFLRLYVMKLEP